MSRVLLTSDAHWRDSARPARFWMVDARAAFPLFFFFIHIRMWTFLLVVFSMTFFSYVERKGYTVPVFLRWLRQWIAGPIKMARPWWRRA